MTSPQLAFLKKNDYNINTMNELRLLLQENLNSEFISAVLSNPRDREKASKIKVRPLLKKGKIIFQIETFRNNQAFHENLLEKEAFEKLLGCMQNMRQMQFDTELYTYVVLVSKKGKVTIRRRVRKEPAKQKSLTHNRRKQYILEEGVPVPFLVDLGVMTPEGRIVNARFDKFRQINRFLEFIEDVLQELPRDREVTIVDFGCGKSYLTFAMYYYLHELKGYDVSVTGLDLKSEVIRSCNELSVRYGYEKLRFSEGNIADYTGTDEADMVVTLHACDTATDYALARAVRWNAKVILSVPCCQHELNGQMKSEMLAPVLGYGLIKERMAALVTDALRARYLEGEGYQVQVLEFIDMEHTPKNILIRGVKTGKRSNNREQVRACEEFLHVSPTLGRLLEKGDI